ncbi:hypothetical protein AAF712_011432 [Marasmius tenuissimus]|uniref:Uncharacterized protein n=1 Tax=Marasmius tenuissimus TaxID=585030 RepID=A0ABR2ZKF7_9AGAR
MARTKSPAKAAAAKATTAKAPSHTVKNLTIKRSAITPRRRKAKPKPPPLTPEQRKAANEARAKKKAEIEDDVREWLADAKKKAEKWAEQYGSTERFFLDMMFQNGVHLTSPRKTNPYNAFKYFKSRENREAGGVPMNVEALDDLYGDEYDALTDEEKVDMVTQYEAEVSKEEREKIKVLFPSARARAQDVANVIANISAMLDALALRVGIEAMFIIVRNHGDPFMAPTFGWTNEKLRDYMPLAVTGGWDTETVGTHCEGFAIAGCDTSKMATSKRAWGLLLRNEIKLVIDRKLSEVLGVRNPTMEYINFDKKMTYDRGIVCEGWPLEKFAKPSDLGSAPELLERLRNAWLDGSCCFRKLSPEEHSEWRKAYDAKVKTGVIQPKKRRTQKDAGTKRKKPAGESKKAAVVDSENVDDGDDTQSGEDEEDGVQTDEDEVDGVQSAGDEAQAVVEAEGFGVGEAVGEAAAAGDWENVDIEMGGATEELGTAGQSSVKASKTKKKDGKSGAKITKKEKKAAAAASKARKEAAVKKGKSNNIATHPDPPVKERPKPQKRAKAAVSTNADPTVPLDSPSNIPPSTDPLGPPPASTSVATSTPTVHSPGPSSMPSRGTTAVAELSEEDARLKALGESLKPRGIDGCNIQLIRSDTRERRKPNFFAAGADYGS